MPVSRALAAAKADGLSVATFDEAVALREAGLALPILVLYSIPPELAPDAARLAITVTVGDPVLLERTCGVVLASGAATLPLHVQLELETGLGRGGFMLDELPTAIERIRSTPGMQVDGVWSHLAAPADEVRSAAQRERFDEGIRLITDGGVTVSRHLAASGGLVAGSAPAYEAVRPGLATYGLAPDDLAGAASTGLAAALRPVMSLHARPVRVAEMPTGSGISYGPSFTTTRQSRIATLPIGYGDGWPRSLSNQASALVRGIRVPLVGTVAMDAVMADVTDVAGEPVGVDDEFTLLGAQGPDQITAYELARLRTTISWEVVTGMARRLPRVYHAAAGRLGVRTFAAAEDLWRESNSGTATSATSKSTRS